MVSFSEMPFGGLSNEELLHYNMDDRPRHTIGQNAEEMLTVEERNRQDLIESLENIKQIPKVAFLAFLVLGIGGLTIGYSSQNNLSGKQISGILAAELLVFALAIRFIASERFNNNQSDKRS